MRSDHRTFCLVGESTLLIRCGALLLERGHLVASVATADGDVRRWAEGLGLTVLSRPDELLAVDSGSSGFDVLLSVGHLRVLPAAVLALAREDAINFHDGPLPRYAGLNAPAWALLAGEPRHGVTWHRMVARTDAGDVLVQRLFDVEPDETALTLNTRCYQEGFAAFEELLERIESGTLRPRAQALDERTWCDPHARPPAGGFLRFDRPAAELDALVRALDFGVYDNPLGLARLRTGRHDVWGVNALTVHAERSGDVPGTIVDVGAAGLRVATATTDVTLTRLATPDGRSATPRDVVARVGLGPGDRLPLLSDDDVAELEALQRELAPHESFWRRRLATVAPLALPSVPVGAADRSSDRSSVELPQPDAEGGDETLRGVIAWLARWTGQAGFDVAYADPDTRRRDAGSAGLFSTSVPLRVRGLASDRAATAVLDAVERALAVTRRHGTYPRDLVARSPELRAHPALRTPPDVRVVLGDRDGGRPLDPSQDDSQSDGPAALTVHVAADGRACRLSFDPARLAPAAAEDAARQLGVFLRALALTPAAPLGDLPLLDAAERRRILFDWNATDTPFPRDRCVHELFEEQSARTPERRALVCGDEELTYATLDARANRLAHVLRARGVGPGVPVGVHLPRSLDMLVAVLAVQKAGGAYLPMDPSFPADRLAFMLADSGAPIVVTTKDGGRPLPLDGARAVCLVGDRATIAAAPATPVADAGVRPSDVAYLIYTSGSTGRPKGVLVEHRNVVNFFTGMDGVVATGGGGAGGDGAGDHPGVWLAVTSLSFDISVLELLWTLARGFEVVLYTGGDRVEAAETGTGTIASSDAQVPDRDVAFSLFYFASDEGGDPAARYRLLLEGARFADRHGFEAVWTPERHFHAFGGLYPNPAVTGAAVAAVTDRLAVRAGSCVLPLHSPVRVAEDWAVVDNLSGGRAGVAFAAGWQPDDFVLRPAAYADRKDILFRDIDVVRRLWRGEAVSLPGPLGDDVAVRTLPRPVQPELPVWVTAAGNPETFAEAGRAGCNLLTHLLGQSVDELAEKIAVYREAWREAGHDEKQGGEGRVTVMLHTFVDADDAAARDAARGPLKAYLRSAVGLLKKYAWSFPTLTRSAKDRVGDLSFDGLSAEEMDALLEFSFERYADTSGLIGTPERCLSTVRRMQAVGVDELACLIDFGVAIDRVIESLPHLDRLRELSTRPPARPAETPAELIERHGVTHLQCVPSMAAMLAADGVSRAALGRLRELLVGGEAFPPALADELQAAAPQARITNMYGPTETTIWSTTYRLESPEQRVGVPIGRPIANTQIYLLDDRLQPVPVGAPGELWIGGDGVVRGYHDRPDETAARFRPDRFRADPGETQAPSEREPGADAPRIYRTGDLARWRPDGTIEFLGRVDFQVKVRGYRIELGEIEAVLESHPGVSRAVVVAREDTPGDRRLAAYVVPAAGSTALAGELRAHTAAHVPDYMVPDSYTALDALPLTPNGKVDRNALPAPGRAAASQSGHAGAEYRPPEEGTEDIIAEVWRALLDVERVGRSDNFFDLGGHSLLAVRAQGALREALGRELALTDIFRFPTVAALARHLDRVNGGGGGASSEGPDAGGPAAAVSGESRADARRAAMSRRVARRATRQGAR